MNKTLFFKTLTATLLIFLAGCGTGQDKHLPDRQELSAGQFYGRIKCSKDTSYSYALYLPKTYTEKDKTPVIFFFDAHKRGGLPVGKYRELSDTYGFILSGSNNSANGQSPAERDKAIDLMMDDVNGKFNIDTKQIYTSGFSGGARIAAYVGLFKRKVTGVAGCAAGFPRITKTPNLGFTFIGLVGDEDFNYLEMKQLDKSLEETGMIHFLIVYNGAHEWPPPEAMEQGFLFFRFDAMRRHLLPVDAGKIKQFKNTNEKYISKAVEEKNWTGQAFGLRRAIVFLAGIDDVSIFRERLEQLEKSSRYKRQFEKALLLDSAEFEHQQLFSGAMVRIDRVRWLMSQMDSLYNTIENSDDPGVAKTGKRLLNFVSLLSYMYAADAMKRGDPEHVKRYLDLYEKVDPDNPEVYYMKSKQLSRLRRFDQALAELERAASYGFEDAPRMEKDKDFLPLHKMNGFGEILARVRQNQAQ